jgi:hypothetical protein
VVLINISLITPKSDAGSRAAVRDSKMAVHVSEQYVLEIEFGSK